MVNDLTPDEDAITVVAFLQVCQPASPGPISIPYQFVYGAVTEDHTIDIEVTGDLPSQPVRKEGDMEKGHLSGCAK